MFKEKRLIYRVYYYNGKYYYSKSEVDAAKARDTRVNLENMTPAEKYAAYREDPSNDQLRQAVEGMNRSYDSVIRSGNYTYASTIPRDAIKKKEDIGNGITQIKTNNGKTYYQYGNLAFNSKLYAEKSQEYASVNPQGYNDLYSEMTKPWSEEKASWGWKDPRIWVNSNDGKLYTEAKERDRREKEDPTYGQAPTMTPEEASRWAQEQLSQGSGSSVDDTLSQLDEIIQTQNKQAKNNSNSNSNNMASLEPLPSGYDRGTYGGQEYADKGGGVYIFNGRTYTDKNLLKAGIRKYNDEKAMSEGDYGNTKTEWRSFKLGDKTYERFYVDGNPREQYRYNGQEFKDYNKFKDYIKTAVKEQENKTSQPGAGDFNDIFYGNIGDINDGKPGQNTSEEYKRDVQEAVESGKITQEQADALLSNNLGSQIYAGNKMLADQIGAGNNALADAINQSRADSQMQQEEIDALYDQWSRLQQAIVENPEMMENLMSEIKYFDPEYNQFMDDLKKERELDQRQLEQNYKSTIEKIELSEDYTQEDKAEAIKSVTDNFIDTHKELKLSEESAFKSTAKVLTQITEQGASQGAAQYMQQIGQGVAGQGGNIAAWGADKLVKALKSSRNETKEQYDMQQLEIDLQKRKMAKALEAEVGTDKANEIIQNAQMNYNPQLQQEGGIGQGLLREGQTTISNIPASTNLKGNFGQEWRQGQTRQRIDYGQTGLERMQGAAQQGQLGGFQTAGGYQGNINKQTGRQMQQFGMQKREAGQGYDLSKDRIALGFDQGQRGAEQRRKSQQLQWITNNMEYIPFIEQNGRFSIGNQAKSKGGQSFTQRNRGRTQLPKGTFQIS